MTVQASNPDTQWFTLRKRSPRLPSGFPGISERRALRYATEIVDRNGPLVSEMECAVTRPDGRPAPLAVRAVLISGFAVAILGRGIQTTEIRKFLAALGPGEQTALGARWRINVPGEGVRERQVSTRQVDHLLGKLAAHYSPENAVHDHPILANDEIFDSATDELLLVMADGSDLSEEERSLTDCSPSCPVRNTLQAIANRLLADLWEHYGMPEVQEWALDSYPLQTHYGVRSHGAMVDFDPEYLGEGDLEGENPAVTPDEARPGRSVRTRDGHKRKPAGGTPPSERQRQALLEARRSWESQPESVRRPRVSNSRKPHPSGPPAQGAFTVRREGFPQIGPEGRLRHTVDRGAGNTFRGAGRSRNAEIVTGRDKHTLVACGFLPDGSAIPPFLRAFAAVMGGDDRVAAALACVDHATSNGATIARMRLDRGYTTKNADDLASPMRNRGIRLVIDLKQRHQSASRFADGVLLVDGYLFTIGMPEKHWHIERWAISDNAEARRAKTDEFDTRAKFAFRQHATLANGTIQFRGPCYTGGARYDKRTRTLVYRKGRVTVRCVNNPHHRHLPLWLPSTTCVRGDGCKCSATITVRQSDLPSIWEPTIWGTSEWVKVYSRRNLVESFNSVEQYHQSVNRHTIRVFDNRWDLMHMFLVVGGFVRQFYNWVARLGAPDDPDLDPLDPDIRRACIARVLEPQPVTAVVSRKAPTS